ncbi:MAG: hypothetical protein R3314_07140, partial [Longimicrobiales bacterium]|nr:hypothetical protein [Longimicrobiales bacterium]
GVLASGNLAVGRSTLVYEAGVGNGRSPGLSGAGDAGELESEAAAILGVRFRPAGLSGLELGVHTYRDRVDPPGPVGAVDERIIGGHAVWLADPEIVVEYLHFIHEIGGTETTSDAFYAQVGWKLPPRPTIQPYVRWETVDIGPGDPLFTGLGLGYEGVIAGVRWDLADFVALKGELRSEEFAGGPRSTSIVLNTAFVIPNVIE